MFVPKVSLLELVLRGSIMYLGIFAAMRVSRRIVGALGTADLLIVVLVADAAQNAMSAEYHSVTEGVVLVGTIFVWNYVIDWAEYKFPRLLPLLEGKPLPLIQNGRLMRRNLRAELITIAELKSQLREHGIEDLSEVKRCCLEPDGHLSVIKVDARDDDPYIEKRAS
jgi:uncharacterized membrane protein YcaP (DUF421 family)